MSPQLPEGGPAPADGRLPAASVAELRDVPLGVYVHVPWCAARCGYCDFNTYVPPAGALRSLGARFARAARLELELAARVLRADDGGPAPPVATVFLGGGTPSLLAPETLGDVLTAVRDTLGLDPDAEVTCECNPESVDAAWLARLREQGVTRVSFGMQSTRAHVLDALERRHDPERPPAAVGEARRAGFQAVGLDLIYGADGESDDDWAASLRAAVDAAPDSVSAYALTVEPGTRYAAHVRRGARRITDDDVLGRRYAHADAVLTAAGYDWYELSNWARTAAGVCRHTSRTGTAARGGASGPARTPTSAARAGGTPCGPRHGPRHWSRASRPRWVARSSRRPSASSRRC